MSFELKTPQEVMGQIAGRMRDRRLQQNLTQEGLSLRAGISVGTIKHFEKTGKIVLDNLLKMAVVLGCLDEFDNLLASAPKPLNLFTEEEMPRKKGRLK